MNRSVLASGSAFAYGPGPITSRFTGETPSKSLQALTSGGEVSLTLIADHPGVRLSHALEEFTLLRERLVCCETASSERGSLTLFRRLKRVTRANVALIGDASGSVDSITGEGMCLAFRQAIALADCLAAGWLDGYQRMHTAISRRARLMARLMLLLAHCPGIRQRVLGAFSDQPEIFGKFIAVRVGEAPLSLLGTQRLLPLRAAQPLVSRSGPRAEALRHTPKPPFGQYQRFRG